MKKLETTKNISKETLVLDPDLIDLTIIPPPMTPDEVFKKIRLIVGAFYECFQYFRMGLTAFFRERQVRSARHQHLLRTANL